MAHRDKSTALRVYVGVLLLLLLVNSAGFWYAAIQKVSLPYELDYGEGIVLYQASKVTNLPSAYKPIDEYPFVVFHYPPLYHITVRAFALLTRSLITAGRWVSVASGLLVELIIGFLVFSSLPRRLELTLRLAGALFAALLPNLLYVMRWTWLARVDMLAILLSFVGITVFVLSGRQRVWQYAAFALFIAALFTKQTMVAAPLACLTAALVVDARHAARLALFAGILGTTVLAALSWVTQGEVIRHLFLYNQNPFRLMRMLNGLAENFKTIVPLVALAWGYAVSVGTETVGLIRHGRWDRLRVWLEYSRHRRLAFVCSALLIFAVMVSLTYGKNGSNYNYFLEWNLACCPLAALVLFRGLISWHSNRSWSPALVIAYLLPILILLEGLPDATFRLLPRLDPVTMKQETARGEDFATALRLIQQAQGPVLSEDMLLLIEAGKEVPAEPAILQDLASRGLWDERPFIRMIEEHRFPIIVVKDLSNRLRFTQTVAAAISRAYSRTREIGAFQIYEPRWN